VGFLNLVWIETKNKFMLNANWSRNRDWMKIEQNWQLGILSVFPKFTGDCFCFQRNSFQKCKVKINIQGLSHFLRCANSPARATVHRHLRDSLHFTVRHLRCVTHHLSAGQKATRVNCSRKCHTCLHNSKLEPRVAWSHWMNQDSVCPRLWINLPRCRRIGASGGMSHD
jgi:hypothetical protein